MKSCLLSLSLAVLCTSLVAQPVTFTGDVAADFPPTAFFITDPGGIDVGIPIALPVGTISGWDMSQCALSYDWATDTLFVGFDMYGIAGDADGDGNPDATSAILAGLGGTDFANWGSTESASLSLDLDDDGSFDVIFGISASSDASNPVGATFTGSIFAAGFAFGAPLSTTPILATVPNAGAEDLEFEIPNFTQILNMYLRPGQTQIGATFFAGSFSDAGIGEDYVPDPVPAGVPVTLFCVGGTTASVTPLANTCPILPGAPVLFVDPPAQGTIANYGVTSNQPNTHLWIWTSFPPVTNFVDPLSGCTVYLDWLNPNNFYILNDTTTDANGDFSDTYAVSLDPSLNGLQLLVQARTWWAGGPVPGGDWLTQGALVTFGCP